MYLKKITSINLLSSSCIISTLSTDDIEWPDNEDWTIQEEAKDLITSLLQHSPRDRLGRGGAQEVKEQIYFCGVDWNSLLRQKAEFVPQLDNEEDTSYFDSRIDRYNHDIEDDTDDTDDSPVFGLFSSCSSQYRKVHTSRINLMTDHDSSIDSMCITSIATTPTTPENSDGYKNKSKVTLTTPDKECNSDNKKVRK